MTYDHTTPILGAGTVSAEAIDAWFASVGPTYARSYAPDATYRPAPAGIGGGIIAACRHWQPVNHDIVAAQIVHESAAWQSAIARDKNNPSGLGAVNDNAYAGAVTFATPEEGIRATVAHLLSYAVGNGPWRDSDPRYDAVALAGWLGVARTWGDLNGRWAYPGRTYAQMVTSLANQLVDFANNGNWPRPDGVPIVEMLLPNDASNTPQRGMTPRWVTIHETANPTEGADAVMHGKWLLNLAASGASEPSWQYTVDDHQIVRHLPEDRAGWHAGDGANGTGNLQSIGIELCVNRDGDMQRTRDNAAWLVRDIMARHNIPVERVVQHNHWSGKDCPRLLRQSGWAAFVASLSAPEPPPAPAPYRAFPETGHGIGGGFLWFWEHNGGLPIFGYPLTEELQEDGRTVQYFERAVFEYHPENPPEWQVLLRRLGAEALERKIA